MKAVLHGAAGELKTHENWNRYYDPSLGRYLQPEPLAKSPSFVSLLARVATTPHQYAYALDNPNKFTDPDGENPPLFLLLGGMVLWLANDETTTDGSGLGDMLAGASIGGGTFTLVKTIVRAPVRDPSKPPKNPAGCTRDDVGNAYGWPKENATRGTMRPGMRPTTRPSWMTRSYTREWRDFYEYWSKQKISNPSAGPCREFLDELLRDSEFWE